MAVRPARYGLRGDNGMVALAVWDEMDGFFVGRESAYDAYENPAEDPETVRLTLRGVDWLDTATDRPTRTLHLGETVLEVIAGGGHTLGDYALWETELTVPAGSTQASLTARIGSLPHAGGEWAWEQWRAARAAGHAAPAEPNLWAGLPVGEREAWLEVARIVALRENLAPYPVIGEQVELDGRHVDDLASLLCALGEALAGPGGSCGSSLADLADCLRHGPRKVARPRLVWRQIAVAERGLGRTVDADGRPVRYLDLVLGLFLDGIVEVVPA